MAAERVAAEEEHVDRQHQRADADAEVSGAVGRGEPVAAPRVEREDDDEDERGVEEIAMHVLQDERQGALPEIARAWLTDGTARRIGPERLVIRAAVVVAGKAKTGGTRQDE